MLNSAAGIMNSDSNAGVCVFLFQLGEVVNTLCGYKTLTRQVRTFSYSPKSRVHLGTDDRFIHSEKLDFRFKEQTALQYSGNDNKLVLFQCASHDSLCIPATCLLSFFPKVW